MSSMWAQVISAQLEDFRTMDYPDARRELLDLAETGVVVYGVPEPQAHAEVSWLLRDMFPTEWLEDKELARDTARFIRLCDVVPESVFWLWGSRIPMRRATLLDGDPGLGKSTLTLDIAARVTNGSMFPDGWKSAAGGVVILSAEDGVADTIRPRMEAAGADLGRVLVFEAVLRGSGLKSPPDIANDLVSIAQVVTETTRLLIVDPLMAYLPTGVNAYRDHEIRRCLLPLAEFASKTGIAVLLVRHLKKADHSAGALYAGGGSIGISGAARSVLLVAKDPENPMRRVLAAVKSNLCRIPPSLAFAIEEDDYGVSTIAWENFPVAYSADDLVSSRKISRFQPN